MVPTGHLLPLIQWTMTSRCDIWRQKQVSGVTCFGLAQIIPHRWDSKICHWRPVIHGVGPVLWGSAVQNPIPHAIQPPIPHAIQALRTNNSWLGLAVISMLIQISW